MGCCRFLHLHGLGAASVEMYLGCDYPIIRMSSGSWDKSFSTKWAPAVRKVSSARRQTSLRTSVTYDFGIDEHRHEGRVITAEYPDFYLVCCYTPNSKDQLARLDYRMAWEDDIRDYLLDLDAKKPVVYCGDLNVAHQEIDIKNPGPNRRNPGFTDEEREKMTKLLSSGFVDTFRYLYPDKTGAYSWWSYRFNARKNNAGWRIDYFIVSERLKDKIRNADIWSEVLGSDHCPVVLDLDV